VLGGVRPYPSAVAVARSRGVAVGVSVSTAYPFPSRFRLRGRMEWSVSVLVDTGVASPWPCRIVGVCVGFVLLGVVFVCVSASTYSVGAGRRRRREVGQRTHGPGRCLLWARGHRGRDRRRTRRRGSRRCRRRPSGRWPRCCCRGCSGRPGAQAAETKVVTRPDDLEGVAARFRPRPRTYRFPTWSPS